VFFEITRHSTISPKRTGKRDAEEPRRSTTEARPKVSCGAPRRRQGAEEEHHRGKAEGFVQSTEAGPKVSCGAPR
jgi:hypothetical protein